MPMPKYSAEILNQEYRSRLERVEAHIRGHLKENLTLEKIAAVACFSKFHFHRIFKNLHEETIHDYIRRIRLEESLRRLREDTHASVSEIALGCGFSNPQNFTRAFKARFGLTPVSFRRKSAFGEADGLAVPGGAGSSGLHPGPLRVEVKILPSYRVAYIRHIGAYPKGATTQPFYRLFRWAIEKGGSGTPRFSISAGWSDTRVTPPAEWIMDACLIVTDNIEGTGEVQIQDLPGGKFAVFHGEVLNDDMRATALRMIDEWLPSSGYQLDLRPNLVIMYNNPNANPRKLIIADICLPIRPL
jgi:AraC family transcriptional regulator